MIINKLLMSRERLLTQVKCQLKMVCCKYLIFIFNLLGLVGVLKSSGG